MCLWCIYATNHPLRLKRDNEAGLAEGLFDQVDAQGAGVGGQWSAHDGNPTLAGAG
jgi:hypothetical protein